MEITRVKNLSSDSRPIDVTPAKPHVFLTGLPGTGKSKIGKMLSEHYNLEFVDLDEYIETQEKRTISDIFEKDGEPYFRQLERKALLEVINEGKNAANQEEKYEFRNPQEAEEHAALMKKKRLLHSRMASSRPMVGSIRENTYMGSIRENAYAKDTQQVDLNTAHPKIISTGGGIVLNKDNIADMMKAGIVIALCNHPNTIYERVAGKEHRPLLMPGNEQLNKIWKLARERMAFYIKAHIVINREGQTLDETLIYIMEFLSDKGYSSSKKASRQ